MYMSNALEILDVEERITFRLYCRLIKELIDERKHIGFFEIWKKRTIKNKIKSLIFLCVEILKINDVKEGKIGEIIEETIKNTSI